MNTPALTSPKSSDTSAVQEIKQGDRFAFGENWRRFLANLNDTRIAEAEKSLRDMLEVDSLSGKTFLDVGSGSGLFSLAARRLGATVRSLDVDPASVACTMELRRRYFPDDARWVVEHGSALDEPYLASLGEYDVVYSWGVLHHTGNLWKALDLVQRRTKPGGKLFIALYNDQGRRSRYWKSIKKTYCSLPRILRPMVTIPVAVRLWGLTTVKDLLRGRPLATQREYFRKRGMSAWRDVVDWVGGYPFEVSKPHEVFDFLRQRGFTLARLTTVGGGLGCNQFVFEASPAHKPGQPEAARAE